MDEINVELHFNIHQLQHPSKIIQTSIQHLFTIHFNIYLPSIHQALTCDLSATALPGGLFRQLGGSTGSAGHWIVRGFVLSDNQGILLGFSWDFQGISTNNINNNSENNNNNSNNSNNNNNSKNENKTHLHFSFIICHTNLRYHQLINHV